MNTKKLPIRYRKLVAAAKTAKGYSYSPYSRFRVGAALLTSRGKIYTGCNVENSSYGLTICAERTAIFKAVSEGEKEFFAIAVVSDSKDSTPPCGACRQVLMELARNIDFVMADRKGNPRIMKLTALLPYPFDQDKLPRR